MPNRSRGPTLFRLPANRAAPVQGHVPEIDSGGTRESRHRPAEPFRQAQDHKLPKGGRSTFAS
ncbi:MAG: hypothetical protein DME46_02380 [Verrucomicrobia bacterium]|nr:MAG: hypothetical protein DME46_02380 [Verrucomicrobiota bacterium]